MVAPNSPQWFNTDCIGIRRDGPGRATTM
jgi:hypothetical protein